MKYLLSILIISFFFSGCTTRDAFNALNLNLKQTTAIENTQSGKIMNKHNTEGIYSAIYLNNADKTVKPLEEMFYISIYLKSNHDLNITMNGQKALDIKQLSHENKYAHLLTTQTTWSSYYLISFKNAQSKKITLTIDSGPFSSGPLKYLKD